MIKDLNFSENRILSILILLISIILISLGVYLNNYYILIGIITLMGIFFKNPYILYSIISILYFYEKSYFVYGTNFKIGILYYYVAILIIFNFIFGKLNTERINIKRFKNSIKDKYLFFMLLIFILGLVSSAFSIKSIESIKTTLSVIVAFIIFYLIPKYFWDNFERKKILSYVFWPFYILLMTTLLVNILFYLDLIEIDQYLLWRTRETIYTNSNIFGAHILDLLIMMNLYLFINENVKRRFSENYIFKILILINYGVLAINMILSGSRTSIFATAFAVIPLIYKYWKDMIWGGIPVIYLLWNERDSLYLLGKVGRGTTGRSEIWSHILEEVVPDHLIFGVGAGAFREYTDPFVNRRGLNKSAHNSYINEIMTNGFLGFILWIIVLLLSLRSIIKLKSNKGIYFFSVLSYLVHGIFEIGFFGGLGIRMTIFWIIIVLIESQLDMESTDSIID